MNLQDSKATARDVFIRATDETSELYTCIDCGQQCLPSEAFCFGCQLERMSKDTTETGGEVNNM